MENPFPLKALMIYNFKHKIYKIKKTEADRFPSASVFLKCFTFIIYYAAVPIYLNTFVL